jgi:hypothetical protein
VSVDIEKRWYRLGLQLLHRVGVVLEEDQDLSIPLRRIHMITKICLLEPHIRHMESLLLHILLIRPTIAEVVDHLHRTVNIGVVAVVKLLLLLPTIVVEVTGDLLRLTVAHITKDFEWDLLQCVVICLLIRIIDRLCDVHTCRQESHSHLNIRTTSNVRTFVPRLQRHSVGLEGKTRTRNAKRLTPMLQEKLTRIKKMGTRLVF